MKTIGTVNTEIAGIDDYIEYLSDSSLRDYDIVVFDPTFPPLSRIYFNGGGSCIDIDSTNKLKAAISHWRGEIRNALQSGKNVFVLLASSSDDQCATGYTTPRKDQRNYNTSSINNYNSIPVKIEVSNTRGRRIKVSQSEYKGLYESIKETVEYKAIIKSQLTKKLFLTNDNTEAVGGIMAFQEYTGHLILLPYFNMSDMIEERNGEDVWTAGALKIGRAFTGQIVEIDKLLRSDVAGTPKPSWIENIPVPEIVTEIDHSISIIDKEIEDLNNSRINKESEKLSFLRYQALLYENGKVLEESIEIALNILGYQVENFRNDDLEIDHILIGPSGLRMIGESEGKDNSAVDITKFRQLETNINEDFAREDIETPAKGILFGNAYRLTEPSMRASDFTSKCLTNSRRLGTALVRTRDLYNAVVYALNNPTDSEFKEKCRQAIELTVGDIVVFPLPASLTDSLTEEIDKGINSSSETKG
ncbi:hypothetical protein RB623_05490 [Mesorhizobium sp. LHD-90]|uniref:hypothetical protein n=1 Tax=Mesorhizobium sp. LHD-90 TaxID=3071414 RepID=UPI0027DFBF6E|nr:hypothetical protein [Mesorhizobium sp. LHD-90]MDQ6433502.1 hypothetical protein [Mesorhizobium sp. LHD-90]